MATVNSSPSGLAFLIGTILVIVFIIFFFLVLIPASLQEERNPSTPSNPELPENMDIN